MATVVFADPNNFEVCASDQGNDCNLNQKDANTVDLAHATMCVNGGKAVYPLLYSGVRTPNAG